MKFSANGPDIPVDLIDAAIRGEIVFLCGAGVSQPAGLPDFRTLTLNLFGRLAIDMAQAEQHPFNQGRFEEALGSLSRRLADKRLLYAAVAAELDAGKATDISKHSTVLRLSRDFEGRPAIVTTNFDTLFERALHAETNQPVSDKSFAGAQVPAPGGPRFEGIIHLHGRLSDKQQGLDETDLVLTSADYGEAYLRSGWAARFLYDLARIRTVVLVGYSASDPPIRYILNILEADRERFPDLKEIFALADNRGEPQEHAAAPWRTIAVTPALFQAPEGNFAPFWEDMAAWADLVELPRQWRKSRLEEFSTRPFDQLADWEREQAVWIFKHADAMELLPQLPFSPAWIAFLRSSNLLKRDPRVGWSLGQWAAARLADPQALTQLLEAAIKVDPATADAIERVLNAKDRAPIPPHLEKAWRLLIALLRQPPTSDRWYQHTVFARIKAKSAMGHDLAGVVQLYVPRLHLRVPFSPYPGEAASLSSVCRVEFEPDRSATIDELLKYLPVNSADLWPLLQLATGNLIDALLLARDADQAGTVSFDVPSISDHPQNEHHRGFFPITRLCAELWLRLLPNDEARAAAVAEYWRQAGFALTTRLWLFTLHSNKAPQHHTIVDSLLALPVEDFWAHRKEVMELLRDSTSKATAAKLDQLAARTIAGPTLQEATEPETAQRILDSYIWHYLKALETGVSQLPQAGQATLDEINERTKWSNRALEESDFFWMWSYGTRSGPIGDPAPIAQAPTEKRIEIATDLEKRDAFNQRDAWRVYSKQDPEGALNSVISANDVAAHSERWRDVLWAIAEIGDANDQAKERGQELCSKAFDFLFKQDATHLAQLGHPLVDLYAYAIKIGTPLDDSLWDFLWQLSLADERTYHTPQAEKDPGYELISHAVNSPAGKLARMLINHLGPPWQELSQQQQQRIRESFALAIATASISGTFARAVIVEFIAWLNASLPDLLDNDLLPHLQANNPEATALRSILVAMSQSVGPALRAKLREPLLRGMAEYRGETVGAENAASRLVAYVRDDLSRDATDPARLKPGQARAILTAAPAHMSAAAAEVMADWLAAPDNRPPHERWRTDFAPIFGVIWPADKQRQTGQASLSLAKLAVSAGDAFPEALDAVAPYIVPLDEDWPSLFFASREEAKPVVDRFPRQMLELLWKLLKPAQRGQSHDLGKVLDRVAAADPNLIKDRRFQLLETRAMRLN